MGFPDPIGAIESFPPMKGREWSNRIPPGKERMDLTDVCVCFFLSGFSYHRDVFGRGWCVRLWSHSAVNTSWVGYVGSGWIDSRVCQLYNRKFIRLVCDKIHRILFGFWFGKATSTIRYQSQEAERTLIDPRDRPSPRMR